MSLDRSKLCRMLQKKGFVEDERGRHIEYRFHHDGKKTAIATYVSRGSKVKTIDAGLVSQMARQCMLSNGQFRDLVDCNLDREGYTRILIVNGEIPNEASSRKGKKT